VFIRFVKTMPTTLNWLALLSLALLLIKILYLNQIPELFKGATQLGHVGEGVLGSVLASYVFYLVVIHVKETRDKRFIYPHIIGWAQRVTARCRQQLDAFGSTSGASMHLETLTRQQVEATFAEIDPHACAPLFTSFNQSANWIHYLEDCRITTKRDIAKIMSQLLFLEAPLVTLLTNIDDSRHFNAVEECARYPLKNADLSTFAKDFFAYCEACRALDQYVQGSAWLGSKE
jgi:hypothetical protein